MQLKGVEKKDGFTTLYYELTWNVGWELIISFIDTIIKSDFLEGGIHSIAVGRIAGAEGVDVTNDLKKKGYRIKETSFAKNESGYIAIAGHSKIMNVLMKITIWNQLNHFMVQLTNDDKIEKHGEHCYDKYMDSIEIKGHVDCAITMAENERS